LLRNEREARLQRADLPRLLAMAGFGAVDGPVALAWGLQHTSGTSASLMLALKCGASELVKHSGAPERATERVSI
jgi:hypothetical protein